MIEGRIERKRCVYVYSVDVYTLGLYLRGDSAYEDISFQLRECDMASSTNLFLQPWR